VSVIYCTIASGPCLSTHSRVEVSQLINKFPSVSYPKVKCHVYKRPSMNPILSQLNPALNFTSHFAHINFVLTVHIYIYIYIYIILCLQAGITDQYGQSPAGAHVQESYQQKLVNSLQGDQSVTRSPPTGHIADTEKWLQVLYLCHDSWKGIQTRGRSWRRLNFSDRAVLEPVKL
jgi:hypothetical protein